MTKRNLLIAAAALIVVGLAVMIFLTPARPKEECVPQGQPSSGFVSDDGCPISIESWDKIADYESSPKLNRIVGLIMIVAGIGVGVVGLVKKNPATGVADPPAAA